MAGNISGATPSYVGKTIGLDCYGFISSVYDLSKRESASTLENTSNFYAVDLAKLQIGDMLISSKEDHVYLYVGMKDEDTYIVYDCNSTNSTGKVLKREIPAEHIKAYEYVGRTPWSN
ncbi:MAG: C40 family peptidase [Lachnospiraceae bacterium]|nr:C40 family peptidase [Lachnospiraceae bacterium]